MVEYIEFLGETCIQIENDLVQAILLPRCGGKIISFVYKKTGFELLYQNAKKKYGEPFLGADFSEYDASGFDDAFPNVDAGEVEVAGESMHYPDHGEIWSACFTATIDGETVHLTYTSPVFGYEFEKTVYLEENQLCCAYRIFNKSKRAFPAFYTCHCLVKYEEGMRILMPKEVTEVENVFTGDWLGEAGSTLQYPIADVPTGKLDLTKFPDYGTLKYYAKKPIQEGVCKYVYPKSNMEASIVFDTEKLPYLGLWITAGGYRGEWNCALEPTSGYYDSVEIANQKGNCPVLQPNETFEFTLSIVLQDKE